MASIWDPPGVTWTYPQPRNGAAVYSADPAYDRMFRREDGRAYLAPDGLRGVVSGVPYGLNEINREAGLQTRYWLFPATLSRVNGTFRSVFGR